MDFPGHFQHIFQQLNQQRLQAQLCDCVVEVGGQRFQAHRSILAASSSHFRALLCSGDEAGGAGQGGGEAAVMALDAEVVTPEAFSTLLDMIYTSTLSLGASNVMDVLLAASHLHLNAVVKACKLHLSRRNFPASPPKGWRSVRQQPHPSSHAAAAEEEEEEEEDLYGAGAVVEVSQSGGREDEEARWAGQGEQSAAASRARKRKCEDAGFGNRKRAGGSRGQEEAEEKYGATKGEAEEIQLPSQSDGGGGGGGGGGGAAWEKDGDTVLKVKVGDEGEDEGEEPKMAVVEVKRENLSSGSPEPASPLHDPAQDSPPTGETAAAPEAGAGSLSQLCAEAAGVGGDSIDGLDSLSELAFSCFLAPGHEMGGLEDGGGEEDSLASLTAAAAAAAAASDPPVATADQAGSSSSLAYPLPSAVTSVPVQQLLPPPPPAFSDALLLQTAQSSLTGFLRPGISLETLLAQPGKSRGRKTLRRIAPKAAPGSEAEPSPPPGAAAAAEGGADQPPLTRASDDVLSKCKKAAAEDLVLLVEGEKKYACKICCKTFMNLTDCRKHIRVHTGEKPYPCTKCGKRFSQSSHLYKHSKNSTCLHWRDEHGFSHALH